MKAMKALVVTSGGLDSTTLLYDVAGSLGVENTLAVSFYYGQKHHTELEYAKRNCNDLRVRHHIVDIGWLGTVLATSGSSLISATDDVPDGHYAEENMKSTVVPNRNMIMGSIAAGIAIANNCDAMYMGVHAGDHFIYPDCRPRYFNAFNAAVVLGNEGFGPIGEQVEGAYPQHFVETPYINMTKADIAQLAVDLEVPIEKTWSCYKGGTIHCGRCGTCVERLEAIASTGLPDPTPYADTKFWKEAVKNG